MSNPFLKGASLQQIAHAARDAEKQKTQERYERARAVLKKAGVKVGDVARIVWEVDGRNGGGTNEKTGKVTELTDMWIQMEGNERHPGLLSMGIAAIVEAMRIEEEGDDLPPLSDNPFITQG